MTDHHGVGHSDALYAHGNMGVSAHGLVYCLSMIFSENRYPLFGIML
jgi:hypothetical protein